MSDEQKKTWGNTAMWVGVLTLLGTVIDQLGDAPSWAALVNTPKAFAHFAAPLIGAGVAILGAYHGGSSNGNGQSSTPPVLKTAAGILLALFIPASLAAQTVPGCHDGKLTDPRAYVESLEVGKPAAESSLPAMQGPLAVYQIDVQHTTGGQLRGRVFLPTGGVFGSDFSHAVDIIDGSVSPPQWVWVDRGGPYIPAKCGVDPPPPPPADTGLADRVAALEAAATSLRANVDALRNAQTAQTARLNTLESRPIYTSCKASAFGIGISCRLQ